MSTFAYSFSSEWLKKKRTVASLLTVIGSLLIPMIVLISRLDGGGLAAANRQPRLWEGLYIRNWQLMGLLLLPMGVVLATSLITQLEFRNNTWKQWCTTPQSLTTIFLVKLSVILVMLAEFFLLFTLGIWLTGVLPALFFRDVPYPLESFPWKAISVSSARFFLDILPVVALQYLLSLRFRNFLVPLGAGLGLYVASMIAVHWRHGYWIPYTYSAYNFMGKAPEKWHTHSWAAGYTLVFIGLAYILYITRKEKG
ncbi:MAG TPA: ABC transporter permease [Puia sp.]|nr:ABC transporter permease [Puia sp.]